MAGMDKHTGKVVVSWETKQAYSDWKGQETK